MTHAAAVAVGGVVGVTPLAVGVYSYCDPIVRGAGEKGETPLLPVASLSVLPDDGVPHMFPVIADRRDAWTLHPKEPIGAVYLTREKGSTSVKAFNAVCPHLGCLVEFKGDAKQFRCPCHNSTFELDGKRGQVCVSPRDLDSLECRVEGENVLVGFLNFHTGKSEKKAKG